MNAKIASLTKEIAEIRQAANVDCNEEPQEKAAGGLDEESAGATKEAADEEAAGCGDEDAREIPKK